MRSNFCEVFSEEIKKLKKIRELREIPKFLMIFLNAVHRVVFVWPVLDPKYCIDLAS
jgi:hypothetical protein